MQTDRTQIENLVRLLFEHRHSTSNNTANNNTAITNSSSSSSSLSLSNGIPITTTTPPNNSTLSTNYLENMMHESEIKKKIMLIALNLASDPSVSHLIQRQRREFYEKTKKKVVFFLLESQITL